MWPFLMPFFSIDDFSMIDETFPVSAAFASECDRLWSEA